MTGPQLGLKSWTRGSLGYIPPCYSVRPSSTGFWISPEFFPRPHLRSLRKLSDTSTNPYGVTQPWFLLTRVRLPTISPTPISNSSSTISTPPLCYSALASDAAPLLSNYPKVVTEILTPDTKQVPRRIPDSQHYVTP